jgi:LEA14-like dessication related protein
LNSGKEYSAFTLFLLLTLVVVPVYVLGQGLTHQPPTQPKSFGGLQIQSTSIGIAKVGESGPSLNFKVAVHNPTSFGATLQAANYSVYADGHYVGDGRLTQETSMAPGSTQTFTFPVNVGWESALLATGRYVVDLGNLTWMANGTARIDVGGLSLTVSFEFSTS